MAWWCSHLWLCSDDDLFLGGNPTPGSLPAITSMYLPYSPLNLWMRPTKIMHPKAKMVTCCLISIVGSIKSSLPLSKFQKLEGVSYHDCSAYDSLGIGFWWACQWHVLVCGKLAILYQGIFAGFVWVPFSLGGGILVSTKETRGPRKGNPQRTQVFAVWNMKELHHSV